MLLWLVNVTISWLQVDLVRNITSTLQTINFQYKHLFICSLWDVCLFSFCFEFKTNVFHDVEFIALVKSDNVKKAPLWEIVESYSWRYKCCCFCIVFPWPWFVLSFASVSVRQCCSGYDVRVWILHYCTILFCTTFCPEQGQWGEILVQVNMGCCGVGITADWGQDRCLCH